MCTAYVWQRQCDEKTMVILNRINENEKLNRVLMISKQSNENLKQSFEELKAQHQKMTFNLTSATQTVEKQANTIGRYEKFCSELLSELGSIIGRQNESCYDSVSRVFLRQTLCKMIKVRYCTVSGQNSETNITKTK